MNEYGRTRSEVNRLMVQNYNSWIMDLSLKMRLNCWDVMRYYATSDQKVIEDEFKIETITPIQTYSDIIVSVSKSGSIHEKFAPYLGSTIIGRSLNYYTKEDAIAYFMVKLKCPIPFRNETVTLFGIKDDKSDPENVVWYNVFNIDMPDKIIHPKSNKIRTLQFREPFPFVHMLVDPTWNEK